MLLFSCLSLKRNLTQSAEDEQNKTPEFLDKYLKMLKSPACIGKISAPQQGFTVKRKCVASKTAQVLSQQEQSDSN